MAIGAYIVCAIECTGLDRVLGAFWDLVHSRGTIWKRRTSNSFIPATAIIHCYPLLSSSIISHCYPNCYSICHSTYECCHICNTKLPHLPIACIPVNCWLSTVRIQHLWTSLIYELRRKYSLRRRRNVQNKLRMKSSAGNRVNNSWRTWWEINLLLQ